ncbi:site-specific integrase [Rhodococcus koreensis]
MTMPKRVRVNGPLEPYTDGFRSEMQRRGYAPWSVAFTLQAMAGLSRWLVPRGLDPAGLTTAELDLYVRPWRTSGPKQRRAPRGLPVLVSYLRVQDAIPEQVPPPSEDRVDLLLDEYATFLTDERGLAKGTVRYYRSTAKRFLTSVPASTYDAALPQVTASAIRSFVIAVSARRSTGSVKNTVTALRALLRRWQR